MQKTENEELLEKLDMFAYFFVFASIFVWGVLTTLFFKL